MRQLLPLGARVAAFLLPLMLFPLLFARQRPPESVRPLSRFHDWSTHHVIYPQNGLLSSLRAVETDPRAMFRWHERELADRVGSFSLVQGFDKGARRRRRANPIHRDWSISLGGGTTAPNQFPAKFTFDVNATPSCTTDFAVFPVNVNGGVAQPNIVAFRNLYSGSGGGVVGICNRAGAATANDSKTGATVMWSYNVHAIAAGAAVPGSPTLSLDGNKVAFVESAAGNPAHFHVLAWKLLDGVVANLQTTTSPTAITTFTGNSPAAGSGTATDLTLGAATSSISSPFIDYVRDLAYVGNDQGIVFRIKNVFCTGSCTTAAPSLDTSWGVNGAVTVGATSCSGTAKSTLTGPVLDFVTLNVFVGCADGKVYGFTSAGAPLAISSITVGNGSATGGIVESPIVDGVNGLVYSVAGSGASGTNAVLVQSTTSLGGPCAGGALCIANVGNAGAHNAHAPAFNDSYFSSATSANWLIYMGGFTGAANQLAVYGVTFNGARVMSAGTPANTLGIAFVTGEFAPFTEFKNGATDWLFGGILQGFLGNMGSFNINAFPTGASTTTLQGTGPSGMTIDNSSASGQASSIYFGAQGNNTAVKLTQLGFN